MSKGICFFLFGLFVSVSGFADASSTDETSAEPVVSGCDVTIRGVHGGASGSVELQLGESQVRNRVGWWATIGGGIITLETRERFSEVVSLSFDCNAHRRYRFYFEANVEGTQYQYMYYFPNEDDFTQQTVIDLGDVSRFFDAIEPAPDLPSDEPLAGVELDGEWIRRESNNDPNDGMRIEIVGQIATLTHVPPSAGSDWQVGNVLWQGISEAGEIEVRGSDGRYYAAQLAVNGLNQLELDINLNARGDEQTWVRGQQAESGGDGPEASDDGPFETRGQALSVLASSVWDDTNISVCWEDFAADEATERGWSREAVEDTWEQESAVDFTGWNACDEGSDGIRVEVRDIGPHVDALGDGLNGLERGMSLNFTFSNWGTDCRDGTLDREFCIRAIATHEFGHAMGTAHEQNRGDAPFTCQSTQAQGGNPDWNVTPYDLFSVMNYCNPAWAGNGDLSPSDIQGAVRLYGSAEPNILGAYEDGDEFGGALAAGDFDGDGFDDLAIGAPGEAPGSAPRSGAVFLFRGTETGGLRPWSVLTQSALGDNEAGDEFGDALAAGDFDVDGRDDLAVGAPGEAPGNDPASGAVFLYRGTTDGLEPWMSLTQSGLGNNEMFDAFGRSLATGDFDGDLRLDLAVGAPGEKPGDGANNSGTVFLFRGTATALEAWHAITEEGLSTNTVGDRFGEALAAGDFDGDGKDDLAAGAHGKRVNGPKSGAVFVFRGAEVRLQPWATLDQSGLGSNEDGDWFGRALATGDLNGDGTEDLAVGAPHESPGGSPESGAVFVFTGAATGLVPWQVLDQTGLGSNEEGDGFGTSLAIDDFDGGDAADLAVGAPAEARGSDPPSGAVFIFSGGSSELTPIAVLDQAGLGSNEAGDDLGSALAVGRFSNHAGAHLVSGAPGEAPGSEPASGYVFVYANLDDDPSDTQPPVMRGWYAFGQQY